jgi:hypothetical protein
MVGLFPEPVGNATRQIVASATGWIEYVCVGWLAVLMLG